MYNFLFLILLLVLLELFLISVLLLLLLMVGHSVQTTPSEIISYTDSTKPLSTATPITSKGKHSFVMRWPMSYIKF